MVLTLAAVTVPSQSVVRPTSPDMQPSGARRARQRTELGATWYYVTGQRSKENTWSPKAHAIQAGVAAGHTVFIDRQVGGNRWFGSYLTWDAFDEHIGKKNWHCYEIIREGIPCKGHFELETLDEFDIQKWCELLKQGFLDLLQVKVEDHHLRICSATGIGETGEYEGKMKYSFHVVVDNGMAFASNKDVKCFIETVFRDSPKIPDRNPYGTNQSFKLINQSKARSTRVQAPLDDLGYLRHSVTGFVREPELYNMSKVMDASEVAPAPRKSRAETLPARRGQEAPEWHAVKPLLEARGFLEPTLDTVKEEFLQFSAANHCRECPCCKGSHERQLWFVCKGNAGRYVVKNFSKDCKGITVYSESPKDLLEELVLPDEAVEAAENADSQLIPSLLQHLPNTAATPWAIYYAVACACVNERAPFEVFNAWAERSPKYDAEDASRLFYGLRRSHDGYSISTLQKLVRKACPQFFRVANARYIRQCMEPTVNLQALGVAVEQYTERFLCPLKANYKHLFVRSGCGTGKSQCCKELLQQVKPRSVLILSPRVVFGRSMMHFKRVLPGLRVYSDLSEPERKTHPYLICQMESLWSVAEHYDCIIIDESESCLYQLSSITVKKFEAVTEAFERVVRSSSLCIWADAFLSDRTLVVARELDPGTSALLVHNTHVSDNRRAYCVGRYKQAKPKLLATAAALAAHGDRNVVVCATADLACDIATALGWPYKPKEATPTRPQGPCLLLTGDSSDATKALMEDVTGLLDGRSDEILSHDDMVYKRLLLTNESRQGSDASHVREMPYNHFVYNTTMTVGVNYDKI